MLFSKHDIVNLPRPVIVALFLPFSQTGIVLAMYSPPAASSPQTALARCRRRDSRLDRALDRSLRSARVANDVDSKSKAAKEEGGVFETDQGRRSGASHRARHPHPAVPALQHPVGLADPDAADRRLSVRLEIHLRLFQALDPVQPAAVLGPRLGGRAQAWRHRRLQAAARQFDRLHQARHRPAGRPHPDDRRHPPHQRPAGEARAHRGLRDQRQLSAAASR